MIFFGAYLTLYGLESQNHLLGCGVDGYNNSSYETRLKMCFWPVSLHNHSNTFVAFHKQFQDPSFNNVGLLAAKV